MSRPARLIAALALIVARDAAALEVQINFSAIQRIMSQQVFTEEGRLYVKGDRKNKCSFAYLERPAVSADSGRLVIKANFSGRSARNLFGVCLGLGDSFDIKISAVPFYRGGMMRLKDVNVESPGRDGFYIRRVRAAMTESLSTQFTYNVLADAKRIFEEKKPLWTQELRKFDITAIRIAPDAVVLVMDVVLAVK